MATSLPWRTSLPSNPQSLRSLRTTTHLYSTRHSTTLRAFRRSDFDDFSARFSSGKLWTDVWRSAKNGFEIFLFETQKTAENFDRKFDVSRRFSELAELAKYRAKEIDGDLKITNKWRTFSFDFGRKWPTYKKQLSDFFVNTPLGNLITLSFFLWFALSGWLSRILLISIWVLPVLSPIVIAVFANTLLIQGSCPACQRPFLGARIQKVRCLGCGNIVWQRSSSSKSDIIDVEWDNLP